MADRLSTTQISLQKEKVQEEIEKLIKTFEYLAIKVDDTKKVKDVGNDLDLTKEANRIIEEVKIIEKRLKWINRILFELKLENMNISIANFYDKVERKIEKKDAIMEKRQAEIKKIREALKKMKGKVERV
jgi:hypothetical protein